VDKKIKIMVIDDSMVVRQAWNIVIQREPDMELCGQAAHPVDAIPELRKQWPDVIILDIEMPHVDGLTFLRKIMTERPTPVIICSTLTQGQTDKAMEAFSLGAVAVMGKPNLNVRDYFADAIDDCATVIRSAAKARVQKLVLAPSAPPTTTPSTTAQAHPAKTTPSATPIKSASAPSLVASGKVLDPRILIGIGTSTGGPQALEAVIPQLPPWCPGILIVQHMPANFTKMLAQRLDSLSQIEVREARNGDELRPGLALIAPGGLHMQLRRGNEKYFVDVADGPLVNRHKPSVDVLFKSIAKTAGKHAIGVMLTGMGADGFFGMQDMRNAGSPCLAQDEATSVVWGMPGEVAKRGVATKVVALQNVAHEIVQLLTS
jgi:two-component system, chemotaxis family, protein-glutamate methylesterase/glutaminase